ncbi:MAG: hypothetical protein UW94_C0013G0021 [Parcubacteria group bacterium GW2011_GWA2_45_14]|nr:MAG: hypothetical protein UW94_C0013G0021 [Parcubacteria group bacterium GW2011_GWA2_45_14]OGY35563.1 MAG: hypothetical protein A3B76_02200 [Candidatus Andersenbacteria bacterium RIFCSPHIGHO2_02_FULL_46_16]
MIGQSTLSGQESRNRASGQAGKIVGYVICIIVIDIFFLIGLPIMLYGAEPISNDRLLLNDIDRQLGIDFDTFHEINTQESGWPPSKNDKYLACHYLA